MHVTKVSGLLSLTHSFMCTWMYLNIHLYFVRELIKYFKWIHVYIFFCLILYPAMSGAIFQSPKSGILKVKIYSLKWWETNKWYGCDINYHSIYLIWFWGKIFSISFFFTVSCLPMNLWTSGKGKYLFF